MSEALASEVERVFREARERLGNRFVSLPSQMSAAALESGALAEEIPTTRCRVCLERDWPDEPLFTCSGCAREFGPCCRSDSTEYCVGCWVDRTIA